MHLHIKSAAFYWSVLLIATISNKLVGSVEIFLDTEVSTGSHQQQS